MPSPAAARFDFQEAPFHRAAMERNRDGPELPGEPQLPWRIAGNKSRRSVERSNLSARN
jgi:hypothetical protein